MGVINVTPDSFSDGGRAYRDGAVDAAYVRHLGEALVDEGAHLIDIGGESSRPGADPVPEQEELARVIPVVETLSDLDVVLSVDTTKPRVARSAIAAGCHMINDIGGLEDPAMLEVAAETDVAVCIMHMQGEPRTMQKAPVYGDVVAEVSAFLRDRVEHCLAAGIERDRLSLDPGFGFGKTLTHNLELLNDLERVRCDDVPLVVGLSRKSMLGTITGRDVNERLVASAVAAAIAVLNGADIVRVHDVGASRDAIRLAHAVVTGSPS